MNEHDLLDAVGGIDPKYVKNALKSKKKKRRFNGWVAAAAVLAAAVMIVVGITVMKLGRSGDDPGKQSAKGGNGTEESSGGGSEPGGNGSVTMRNASFYVDFDGARVNYTPSVAPYQANEDLSNVKDSDRYYFTDEALKMLTENNFVVVEGQNAEFFNIYESNRYGQTPNFITSDSMMHTYHLYFAMLQKNIEKQYLSAAVEKMTTMLLEDAKKQYDALKGSEWEEAAKLNVAYFGVASKLLGLNDQVPDYAQDIVTEEVRRMMAAEKIEKSLITGKEEDYTQYKPRGYYDGDEQLEKYFRAMMLYGRLNYAQASETMNRCALLLTLALKENEACKEEWGNIYDVTAFFVGQSDDLTYYEYLPVVDKAYGKDASVKDLIGNQGAFQKYLEGISALRSPEINSEVFRDNKGETDRREDAKGFRFMGQRFTLDAAIFTHLTYSQLKVSEEGIARYLPDGLDVPAAFGSDLALEILIEEEGVDQYPNYFEKMQMLRDAIQNLKDYWSSSLYGGWLYTLRPLLEKKGEGYPSFMTNENWEKKSLEGFLASWTELKHDTVLYAKQIMAEMGGGDDIIYDDRGYVEPQPELYGRLYALTKTTMEGLEARGYLSADDKDGLVRLAELSKRLQEISVMELQNEKLSDDDYEFIRDYGGSLEHLWYDTIKNEVNNKYADAAEFPMALVTDVATNPNGFVLEEAIGGASRIYVIFPIDGELHIGVGGVFNYYQFMQPMNDRLTDKEWRIMLGIQLDDDDRYRPVDVEGPAWTYSYKNYWKKTYYTD